MDENRLDNLLTPSLISSQPAERPYSSTAHVLTGWFGGPIASVLFCAMSVHRMGLYKQHKNQTWLVTIISLVSVMGLLITVSLLTLNNEFEKLHKTWLRSVMQLSGVLVYGIYYLMFKRFFKASQYANSALPSPWQPALTCFGVGLITSYAIEKMAYYYSAVFQNI